MNNSKTDSWSIVEVLQDFKDYLREGLLIYSRQAFRDLPPMTEPNILDIGCGSGIPTIELVRLSGGKATGIDIDEIQLGRLQRKVAYAGLTERITAIKCSMDKLEFPDGCFDIIWCEGAISGKGFERWIKDWKRLLKTGGYLVVHDELRGLEKKMAQIPRCGYELLSYFTVSAEIWWDKYFAPLSQKINTLITQYRGDTEVLEALSCDQEEVDSFRKDRSRLSSVFIILRKM